MASNKTFNRSEIDGLKQTSNVFPEKENIHTKEEDICTLDSHNIVSDPCVLQSEVPPIELSLQSCRTKKYETVERRYYKRYYKLQNGEDQVVLLHSNRICLVSIAQKHPIIERNLKIIHLEFEVGNKRKPTDRLSNKVTGKGKKGGQSIDEKAILCWVHCENGSKYAIRSCLRGTLIEINPLVVENPQLLATKPLSEGHLAVILPKLPEGLEKLKTELLTEQEYHERLDKCIREPPTSV